MSHRSFAFTLAVCWVILLASCGSSDGGNGGGSEESQPAATREPLAPVYPDSSFDDLVIFARSDFPYLGEADDQSGFVAAGECGYTGARRTNTIAMLPSSGASPLVAAMHQEIRSFVDVPRATRCMNESFDAFVAGAEEVAQSAYPGLTGFQATQPEPSDAGDESRAAGWTAIVDGHDVRVTRIWVRRGVLVIVAETAVFLGDDTLVRNLAALLVERAEAVANDLPSPERALLADAGGTGLPSGAQLASFVPRHGFGPEVVAEARAAAATATAISLSPRLEVDLECGGANTTGTVRNVSDRPLQAVRVTVTFLGGGQEYHLPNGTEPVSPAEIPVGGTATFSLPGGGLTGGAGVDVSECSVRFEECPGGNCTSILVDGAESGGIGR